DPWRVRRRHPLPHPAPAPEPALPNTVTVLLPKPRHTMLRLTPARSLMALAVIALLAGAAALLGSPASRADAPAPAAVARPALTVSVVRPARAQVAQHLAANGNIAAWQEASIGAEVNGMRLTEV